MKLLSKFKGCTTEKEPKFYFYDLKDLGSQRNLEKKRTHLELSSP